MTIIVINATGSTAGFLPPAAAAQLGAPNVVPPPDPLPPLDAGRLRRLDDYAARFADVFTRTDQSRWFRLYLRGLLDGGDRKNVEAIAARVRADDTGPTNFAQALQHFVSHSPWDAARIVARYRELLPTTYRETPGATWVVHDGVIPKKGRHSVGAQRQFARSLRRKVNCQVAVVVGRAGPFGYVPLAVRLYLPGYWLRENLEAAEKTVPEGFREHASKPDIARVLLDELTREGWAADGTVADEGYRSSEAFRDARGHGDPALATANAHFDHLKQSLGLDHFEGRTWVGWHHHAALVLAAHGFLTSEAGIL